jgi:hypothetical protein
VEQQAVTVVLWLFRDNDNRWRDRGDGSKPGRALACGEEGATAPARATDQGSALHRLLRKLRGGMLR